MGTGFASLEADEQAIPESVRQEFAEEVLVHVSSLLLTGLNTVTIPITESEAQAPLKRRF